MKKAFILFCIAVWPGLAGAAAGSFPPQATAAEFAAWQSETRAWLGEALYNGPAPEAVPLAPTFGAREQRDNYELTEVTIQDRPGHATSGLLARPLNPPAAKLPLVIALHGHGGRAHDLFDPDNELYFYGDLLARQGYIVFAPNIDHSSLEHTQSFLGFGPLPRHVTFPAMGQRVWMVRRALDFMLTQPDVDPDRIGVVGLSNGGMTTMFVAAMDTRVTLAVASGSLIMHDRMWRREILHCRCQYLDRLDGQLDYYDVFALVAPRYLLVQSGEKDPIFPIGSANKAFAHIQEAYNIAGFPDRVAHDVHPGAHVFSAPVPEQWFHQYLPLPP